MLVSVTEHKTCSGAIEITLKLNCPVFLSIPIHFHLSSGKIQSGDSIEACIWT